jgi:hypothetical protein
MRNTMIDEKVKNDDMINVIIDEKERDKISGRVSELQPL